MKTMLKRTLAIVLACLLCLAVCSGCGEGSGSANPAAESAVAETPAAAVKETAVAEPAASASDVESPETTAVYVQEEPVTITGFAGIYDGRTSNLITSWDEHPQWKKSFEATNVNVEMTCVASSAYGDAFALMAAANDSYDFVEFASRYYTGGFEKMIEDGFSIDLAEYMNDYYMPDYVAAIEAVDGMKDVYTDSGIVGCYYQISESTTTGGMMIRQDWLDALKLEVPTTIDELSDVLAAFKTEYSPKETLLVDACGAINDNHIVGAYDIALYSSPITSAYAQFIQRDGQVYSSFIEDGFDAYITQMAEWYQKGYFTSDFLENADFNSNEYKAHAYNGDSGVFCFRTDNIPYLKTDATDEGAVYTPMADPVLKAGDKFCYSAKTKSSLSESITVTTSCEHPEAVACWINYWFTEEGKNSYWGEESETYTVNADGSKQFTDFVFHDETYPTNVITYSIMNPKYGWETIERKMAAYEDPADVLAAIDVWESNIGEEDHQLPTWISLTAEESTEFSSTYSDISTLCNQYVVGLITGDIPLSEIDSFQETLKDMGIDKCVSILQDSLDRYNAR